MASRAGFSTTLNREDFEMASVLFGAGVAEMRGQIGGVIFSVWKGIGTARRRGNPVRRMRTTQPRSRAILGWLARKWGTLSAANRLLWQTWADEHPGTDKFGNPFIMSGMNAYVQLNIRAFKMGGVGGVGDTPPVANLVQTVVDVVAVGGALPGEVLLTWTLPGGGVVADFVEIRMAGPFASPALEKLPEEMDFLQTVAGNIVTATISGLVELTNYWFGIRYVGADGQASNWHAKQAVPTPTP